jgi:hypothetical protein
MPDTIYLGEGRSQIQTGHDEVLFISMFPNIVEAIRCSGANHDIGLVIILSTAPDLSTSLTGAF